MSELLAVDPRTVIQHLDSMKPEGLCEPCFSCGGVVPHSAGPTHRYMASSPGCWKVYGVVLAREYEDLSFGALHRLTVDNYALQHPGSPCPQSIQSVRVHLMSLFLVLERGANPEFATKAIQVAAQDEREFAWLDPPDILGDFTVADVVGASNPTEHLDRVLEWSRSVWKAWSGYHSIVKGWIDG